MRCFLAIDLPDDIQRELSEVQKKLPSAKMTLVKPSCLHLTLKFLGEIEQDQVDKIAQSLSLLTLPKFVATLGGLGTFSSSSDVRVVWVSLEPEEGIRTLHDQIDRLLQKEGFALDDHFESHITLARVKAVPKRERFMEELNTLSLRPLQFPIETLSLKKSTLMGDGPQYETLVVEKLR